MYCKNCGALISENSRFCTNCGQVVESEKQSVSTTSTYEGPMGNPTPVLVYGILGLSFALTFFLSFLGIIFSSIGLKKARAYLDFCPVGSKQVTIGRNLSKAGMIVGIIMTVLCVIYIAVILFIIATNGYVPGTYHKYY